MKEVGMDKLIIIDLRAEVSHSLNQETLTQQTQGTRRDFGSWCVRCAYQKLQRGQGRG